MQPGRPVSDPILELLAIFHLELVSEGRFALVRRGAATRRRGTEEFGSLKFLEELDEVSWAVSR